MVHERPPLQFDDVPGLFLAWVQDAGSFAAIGLAFGLLFFLLQRREVSATVTRPLWFRTLFGFLALVAGGAFALHAFQIVWGVQPASGAATALGPKPFVTIGGAAALLAVALPFVVGLARLRVRRILALADLSFREAIRSKVLWVFAALFLVIGFADWFLPHKPEDQLRTYVHVLYGAMLPLLLLPAAVLAAFAIPRDVQQQTIFTVVTKPVERFEIFLGRFLGYAALLSGALLAMTAVSLWFVGVHAVHPDTAEQSYRARVPLYGTLDFRGRSPDTTGVKMREWAYRRYIPGGPTTASRAVWTFTDLPTGLDGKATVPCEFKFDIVRMTKGEEGRGVFCTLTFEAWNWRPERKADYDRALAERLQTGTAARELVADELAREFGYYEHPSKEVFDRTTYAVDVPASLFKSAEAGYAQMKREREQRGQPVPPLLVVTVRCESVSQFLGMAKYDLYFVQDEGRFAWNFFKGALGLWFRLCLVIGVAVAASTYLSGVVSLLTTLFLYGAGVLREYIQSVAANTEAGGGPTEALYRLVLRENLTAPLEQTPTTEFAKVLDATFRWSLRQMFALFPDVDRFDLSSYVAEGFSISGATLVLCLLQLLAYLLPWFVLGYYALRSREMAS